MPILSLPPRPFVAPPANPAGFIPRVEGDEWILVRQEAVEGFPNTIATGISATEAEDLYAYVHRLDDGGLGLFLFCDVYMRGQKTIPLDLNDPLAWSLRAGDVRFGGTLANVAAEVDDLLGMAAEPAPVRDNEREEVEVMMADFVIAFLREARAMGIDIEEVVRKRLISNLRYPDYVIR